MEGDSSVSKPGGWLGRRRPTRMAALVLFAFVVAAAIVLVQSKRRVVHDFDSGPLQTGSRTGTSFPVELGQIFTYGGIILSNTSDRSAVIDEIRTVPAAIAGMEIVDIKIAGPSRGIGMVGTDTQFPPPDIAAYVRPYRGAEVAPKGVPEGEIGVEVLFGLRVDRSGRFGIEEFHIDYHIGKKAYTVRLEDRFMACAPLAQYKTTCHDEEFFRRDE